MPTSPPLDSLGRRRSPASVPGYLAGRPPRGKGRRYPADPPRTEEIIAVVRCCGEGVHGARARALIVVLWRAGLRIQEALDLTELDLDPRRGSVLVQGIDPDEIIQTVHARRRPMISASVGLELPRAR
jgi:integrase